MNLRRLDLRMALSAPPRSALVMGGLAEWRQGLAIVGVELHEEGSAQRPDLTVAPVALARRALGSGARMLILEGRGSRRALRRSGRSARRFLPLPLHGSPNLLVPLEAPNAAAYALDRLRAPASRSKRARNAAFRLALAHGAVPEPRAVQTIALDAPALPFLVQPARELGVAAGSAWLQALGGEDVLSRGVFHLFAPGERDPQWVVKFARTQGHAAPFEADERGLRLAAGAGGEVAVHAPSLLGRFNVGGFEASAETAVVGRPLSQALVAPGRREQPLRMVERVAAWTVALARRTVSSAEAAAPELRRLRDEVIPEWLPHGAPADLLERLPSMRAVLAHNDLGTWNVIVEDGSFGITDWESARDGALPIWDLLYLLADALPILGGARTVPERVANTLALLRGSHPYSRVLFRWLEVAAKTTGVSPEAIGPLATLCWLHHGRSHLRRWAAAELAQPGSRKFLPPAEQIAAPWLKDPELGAAWPAWQRYVAASI